MRRIRVSDGPPDAEWRKHEEGGGLMIALVVLGFNLLGDDLREALDLRLRWTRG